MESFAPMTANQDLIARSSSSNVNFKQLIKNNLISRNRFGLAQW